METAKPPSASSIAELAQQADLPPMDNKIPVIRYYRSAQSLLQQATIYKLEGDLEMAYVFMLKYATLIIERIPKHKYISSVSSREKESAKKNALKVLTEMEELKVKLNKLYDAKKKEEEKKLELLKQQELKRQEEMKQQRLLQEQQMRAKLEQDAKDSNLSQIQQEMRKLELQEIESSNVLYRNFPTTTTSVTSSYLSSESQLGIQDPLSLPSDASSAVQMPSAPPSVDATAPSLQDMPPTEATLQQTSIPSAPSLQSQDANVALNTQAASASTQLLPQQQLPPLQGAAISSPSMTGMVPVPVAMNPYGYAVTPQYYVVPQMGYPNPQMMVPMPSATAPQAASSTSVTTSSSTVPSAASSGQTTGSRLRKIIVEGQMFNQFMQMAHSNTARDIETCGILAGTLKNNVFQLTHLIIPKQKGSSDTCAMTNEDEVFSYQEKYSLLTLGWIHTHPSHDLFLSSIDMHTQFGYQVLLKEAIAIVIAPKRSPNVGIFALTSNGLDVIQDCAKTGFHPHEKGLYNSAPHVEVITPNSPSLKIVDLRR